MPDRPHACPIHHWSLGYEYTKGVFGNGMKWNGMSWLHSIVMERFHYCVWFGQKGGMEWFHFVFGWDKISGTECLKLVSTHLFHINGEITSHTLTSINIKYNSQFQQKKNSSSDNYIFPSIHGFYT